MNKLQKLFGLLSPFLVMSLCLSIMGLTGGCSSDGPKEPSNDVVQQSFRQNISGYEELLKMFQEDVSKSNISFVSTESKSRTKCDSRPKQRPCDLREGRWENYRHRFGQLGVLSIEYEEPDNRYYFTTYYKPILMNARIRGVVFAEKKNSQVSVYYPKQEWWPIQNGWYSFLMIE